MTKEEYNEAAALVVRLRKELELHTDALVKSNAQCGEYLRQNEQLRADVATVAEELKRDISSLVHAASAERDKLHRDLVEVRAALAATTEQRDSLKRTLDEWERADTKPHERIELPTVQDDLEFRAGIPTPAMLAVCSWWEVQGRGDVICFKNKDQRPVVWRSLRGDASWQYEDCPQPLKPSKRTWRQLDALLAEPPSAAISTHDMPPLRMGLVSAGGPVYIHDDVADHVVPPVLPMCMTCHHCGNALDASVFGPYNVCTTVGCPRTVTNNDDGLDKNPYDGPCHAGILVRHE